MQKALLFRVATVLILMALLLIPLEMIGGLVTGRQHLQTQVESTVAASFAGPQRAIGPLLVIPYIEREIAVSTDAQGRELKRTIEHQREVLFVPERLSYEGAAEVEAKYKGLYKALVYQTKGVWRAQFEVPANLGLDISQASVTIGNAYLAFGLCDVRGLRSAPQVSWETQPLTVSNGAKLGGLGDGFHAEIGRLDVRAAHRFQTVIDMDLAGMRSLAFAPVGKTTVVQLRATWPHPNFGGRFLPHSKRIDEHGFTASWEVSHLASKNDELLKRGLKEPQLLETFDVSFIEPVNIYQQAERAVKYGVLFVALTFAAFFLFEILKDLRIHPLQYGLVGLAQAVFFLLLVSLSEHVPFPMAYLAASAACVLLIGYYLSHVLGGKWRGVAFAAKLAVLYGVLYGLLLSDDNALVLGSLLLFLALAAIMVLTRRVDWYQLGAARKAPPA